VLDKPEFLEAAVLETAKRFENVSVSRRAAVPVAAHINWA
jgi:hypothetical protein